MAANQYGIDMGQVLRDSESIKSARTQNKLAGLKLSEAEGKVERRNLLSATPNDSAAQQKFLMQGGDPQLIAQINALSSQQKQEQQQQSQEIVQRSAYVLGAKSDGEYMEKWGQATKDMDPAMFEGLPATDTPEFIPASRKFLTDAFSMNKAIQDHISAGPKKGKLNKFTFGNEDIMTQGGSIVSRTSTAKKAPLVSINNSGAKKESEKVAELRVKRLDELQQKAIQAEEQIESIRMIGSIDLDTGLGVEARGQIARVWDSLGGDGKALTGIDPSDVEKFKAVGTKMVLDIMASQKGPQTDQDAKRIEKAVANLGNTKDANQFIMNSATSIAYRKIEQAQFAEAFLENNGTLKGTDTAWNEFKRTTPMLSDIVKDPETGAPLFFYQFKERMMKKGFEIGDITTAWRMKNMEDSYVGK